MGTEETFAQFEMTVPPLARGGEAKIVVNGQDLTNRTRAVALFAASDQPTTLQIHMYGQGKVEGAGIVEVHTHTKEGTKRWLRSLNPKEIDQLALNKSGWGDQGTLTDKVIEVLLEKLDENTPEEDPNDR